FVEATAIDFDNDPSAPAQLSIGHDVLQIQDDGPSVNEASADANGVSAADPGTAAEGNLLDNDNVGTDTADGFDGRVISIGFEGDTDALGPDGQGNLVLVTEYGTLTVEQDGSYSFELNADNPEVKALPSDQSLDIEFSYTFTDGDGDPESQTLTITIAGSNQPPAGAPKAVTVSEEGLVDADDNPIGNMDTTDDPYNVGSPAGQDDTNLATAGGQFAFTDPDGDALTYSIFAPNSTYYAADGSAITWSSTTNLGVTTLTGKDGSGESVIVVTLDKTTGAYDVTLEGPVYHDPTPTTAPATSGGLPVGDGNVESEFAIVFGVTVSDGTATVNTSLTVTIEDDSPIVTQNEGFDAPTLVVDDTLLNSDSADFSDAFDISFGGDGEFDTFYSLNVSQQAAPSGLTETTSGLPIFLYQINGVVYGSTAAAIGGVDTVNNTNVAFTISVDGDGNVTLDQIKPVVHNDEGDPVEAAPVDAEQLTSAGLVTLTATAYDQDGDHQSATIDIGDTFFFEDDGPSIIADTPSDTGVLITSDADITDTTTTDTTPPIASDATLNLATVFGYSGVDYGNDGPGDVTETYGLNITSGAATGLTSGGLEITLEYYDDGIAGTDSVRGVTSEGTVFTVQVNQTTGVVTLTQLEPLDHAANSDQIGLPNGFLTATYEVEIVDGDGDTDSDTKSIDLGGNLLFNDDVPDIAANDDPFSATLDESPLPTAGDGIYSVSGSIAFLFTLNNTAKTAAGYGNDVPGSVTYALALSVQNVFSGLYALDNTDTETATDPVGQGAQILLYQNPDGTIVGYTGDINGVHTEYFTLSVDADTGLFTLEYANGIDPDNIWHGNTSNIDDTATISLAANVLTVTATATDYDDDSDTASYDLGQGALRFQDDGPSIDTPASDSEFSETANPSFPLLATGTFGFDFGTDGMFGNNVDKAFSFDLVSGTVAGVAISGISDPVFNPVTDTWEFSFTYTDNNGDPQVAHGYVDVADNGIDYTVALDTNFEFTTVDQFSDVISRTGYNLTGNAASQYEIVVSQLDTEDPVYVQFQAYNGTLAAGGNTTLVGGETVTGGETWASISNTENGVAGDTIQRGEVLDFDLFTSDPGGVYSDNGTLGADGLTLLLDGFGSEDLIVILKLEDANNPANTTTKILIVGQEDVYTSGDVIPGYNVTLDQNDGFIVIESNDFNSGSENWVITGAQLLSSSDGLSDASTGILLNGDVGADGDTEQTTVTFASAGTNDQDVVKITDIGLIRTVTDEQAVTLNFDVTVKDGDGDSVTDSFTVNPIIPPVVLDLDGDGVELLSMAAGVTYDYGSGEVATAWAGEDDGILAKWNGGDFSAENFVFGDSERTDLEALAQDYDANGDGVLSGDELNGFGVWQDANSDGVFDDGEFSTLADLGITEISVTHTSAGYIAADGDAIVYGESTYTMDGKVYALADVGFATSTDYSGEGEPNQLRQAELALLAAAAPGLLVASALETTTFFADQHMVNFVPTDLTFDRAVSSVSLGQGHRGESHAIKFEALAKHEALKAEDSAKLADNDDGNHHQSSQDLAPTAHEVADLGGSSEAAATFTAPSIPAGGSDMGGELMAALMQLGTKGGQTEGEGRGTAALDAVRAALHEVTGKDAISELVDHIVDNKPESAQHGHVGIDALNVLLNSGVAGQHFHAPVMADAADDAAHLAAAAAA
ncbi:DUF5801 repeats-in-toxin domain-containing protein, partial [Croceicoccus sp. BE223]|uniref:DUF5801 repeats-in-toxin domain-containing protein n=1 Tax=Croceicoccus sp. BE223 TaxID=2817716 RepID=UPI0028677FBA